MNFKKWSVVFVFSAVMLAASGFQLSYSETIAEGKYSVAGLDNEKEVEMFFVKFREAVKKHEKEKVSRMISYPIKVTYASRKSGTIKTAMNFVTAYDNIFDSMLTDAISNKSIKELWANSNGVSTETGEIWFGGVIEGKSSRYELKILTINGVTARH